MFTTLSSPLGGARAAFVVTVLASVVSCAGDVSTPVTHPATPPATSVAASTTDWTPTPDVAVPTTTPSVVDTSPRQAEGDHADSLAKLATLQIKGRAPKTGYDRGLFGDAWTDDVTVAEGHNGCDTRNDVLRRDLFDLVIKPSSNGCAVLRGTLRDPYTGTSVPFERGQDTSSQVQIDHLVALSDAWQKGAQQWSAEKRRDFANDPINLQATIGDINQSKGDADAATWLPPNRPYRCAYVARIVSVKSKYGLWVTQAEHDAIADLLTSCGVATPLLPVPPPPATTPESSSLEPPPQDTSSVYYPSCEAAKEAGAGPLYAGQPGYHTGLDGDGDGVACEN